MTPGARWRIAPDPAALAEAAAETIVRAITSGSDAPAVCLTGGTTPRRVYELLAREPFVSRVPWRRVHWFIGDERFVPEDDPRSNIGAARRAFLDRCAPHAYVHAMRTDVADVHAAADLYEGELRAFAEQRPQQPLFDLMLLGIGPDGHVASLFPESAAAREVQRWAVGVDEAAVEPFVSRVSLTLRALSSCRELLFMAEGAGKAAILTRIAQGEDLPATRVTPHDGALWLVDREAAPSQDALGPRLVLVMGVSGSGKTTIGGGLAAELGWSFLDADDLHSAANKAKMHAGAPLTDDDRAPWLAAVHAALARERAEGADVVVACSALKRRYRNVILQGFPRSRIVHLRGAPALIAERLEKRAGHFMSPALLGDQLSVLEQPEADEHALMIDVDGPASRLVDDIVTRLRPFLNAGRL